MENRGATDALETPDGKAAKISHGVIGVMPESVLAAGDAPASYTSVSLPPDTVWRAPHSSGPDPLWIRAFEALY